MVNADNREWSVDSGKDGREDTREAIMEALFGKMQEEAGPSKATEEQKKSVDDNKKAMQFDRIVGEWKSKVDSIGMDLDSAQKETRNASSELFRVKSAYEEAVLQLDEVRRENKNLSNEIKDIMDQISE